MTPCSCLRPLCAASRLRFLLCSESPLWLQCHVVLRDRHTDRQYSRPPVVLKRSVLVQCIPVVLKQVVGLLQASTMVGRITTIRNFQLMGRDPLLGRGRESNPQSGDRSPLFYLMFQCLAHYLGREVVFFKVFVLWPILSHC